MVGNLGRRGEALPTQKAGADEHLSVSSVNFHSLFAFSHA